jgi:predicted DsbA family dithiol-disulfide isomerase
MQIDVISDTVCPWCFIGKRRLGRAMALRSRIEFDVKWRPFQLDPTIPRGGM